MPPEPLRLPPGTRAVPAVLDSVHDLLEQAWVRYPDVTPADRMGVETAVVEVAANIVEHATGGAEVDLMLEVEVAPERVVARLHDTGLAFDAGLDAVTMPDDEGAERGRGLALARALSDEVAYERTGATNCWRVVRLRR